MVEGQSFVLILSISLVNQAMRSDVTDTDVRPKDINPFPEGSHATP
jgi:hypothetical protein